MERHVLNVKKMVAVELRRFVDTGNGFDHEGPYVIDGKSGLKIVEEENSQSKPSDSGQREPLEMPGMEDKSLSSFNYQYNSLIVEITSRIHKNCPMKAQP
jgi:hypothetical protein